MKTQRKANKNHENCRTCKGFPIPKHSNCFINLKGKSFNRWSVLHDSGLVDQKVLWHCRCVCGNELLVPSACLINGSNQSCGCLLGDLVREAMRIKGKWGFEKVHGNSSHSLWPMYKQMIERCGQGHTKGKKNYAGRGIRVCVRWVGEDGFANFLKDMGLPKGVGLSIERINNDGNYEPDNCCWATRKEQARNRRSTLHVEWEGNLVPLAELAEIVGLPYKRLWKRVYKGMTIIEAVAKS